MAPHSSTLAWKIPRAEEPGRLQSIGSRVRHDWATSLSLFTFMLWRRQWQPTPVFLPRESQGWGAWWAAIYGVAQSRTWLKRLSSSSSSSSRWNGVHVSHFDSSATPWYFILGYFSHLAPSLALKDILLLLPEDTKLRLFLHLSTQSVSNSSSLNFRSKAISSLLNNVDS